MRVLVTGASGFVGTAVVKELIRAGHAVLGLARSEASAAAISAAGAEVFRGDLEDLPGLRSAAQSVDGVIHTAFIHEFDKLAKSGEVDRKAIEAIGEALQAGRDSSLARPFIITSGTALLKNGQVAKESDAPDPAGAGTHRLPSEVLALDLAHKGVKTAIVRLPPTVHGPGDHGFVPFLIGLAKQKGCSAYIGEGLNSWSAVHRLDAAKVYRLALEKATPGSRWHAVDEEKIAFKTIAEAIGKGLGLPTVSIPKAKAQEHFGWFEKFAGLDAPASSLATRTVLDWNPTQAKLLEDLVPGGTYF